MIDWIKRNKSHSIRAFSHDGVLLLNDSSTPKNATPGIVIQVGKETEALLRQLEDEGYAFPNERGYSIGWEAIYDLVEHREYGPSLPLLHIPGIKGYSPVLESRDSLTDPTFSISIADWKDEHGHRVGPLKLTGAVVYRGDEIDLLPRSAWQLTRAVGAFSSRDQNQRNGEAQRRAWGEIRRLALAAGAQLDDFLLRTVVLTPERLEIHLAKNEIAGTTVIEIAPGFANEPTQWLATFDRLSSVSDRYDIPTPEGIVQVLIIPEVKTVLQQIKRMPGRRVSGSQAEAFITNPFAALGEDAARAIDADQFERARAEAGLLFERFTAHVKRDGLGYPTEVGLLIEQTDQSGPSSSELCLFENDEDLLEFIRLVQKRLSERMQLCAWQGYDFELLGDTHLEVEILEKAYGERQKPRTLVSYADIYDLSRYTDRIEVIGVEPPYYSPYIAKKDADRGWFPENIVPVIAWTPEGSTEPVAVPITNDMKEQIAAKVAEAKAAGRGEITLNGFDKPLPIKEADFILEAFRGAVDAAKKGEFDPERAKASPAGPRTRLGLVIRANIQGIDYEEARRDILTALPGEPTLPSALRRDVRLMDHQRDGIAWLQYLFQKAPEYCRGAVLADDMGLGKTLQLLVLIMSNFARRADVEPSLVVAPVSLLENWMEEIERFFVPGTVPYLIAYGDALAHLRAPRQSIDEQLRSQGLVKFLKPGWRGDAKIVLTTYETLRDLEFSFASEKWSIMVCDEAQKIKNPNALVTRAAKKQNVRFKIACTGTPVENTLADLWCLFDFVQPGLLGALNDFGRRYRKLIEAETEEEKGRIEELRAKIRPQILRRTKENVAKDLPKRITVDTCRALPLSQAQRMLYGQAIEQFKRRGDPSSVTPFKNHLSLLHYLRLVCVDPRRYGLTEFRPEPLREYQKRAPKMEWLLSQLEDIRKRKEKAIIFCEFRAIQRLLRHYIEETFQYTPDIINGDTSPSAGHIRSRQKRIKDFQAKSGFGAIILSPLAVGFGVNIQAANHVIHYTRTWNPAKEDQATDRAYRIGQTRDVYVYYPVVRADDFVTFDVKLDRLLEHKRDLARDMLNGAGDIRPSDFGLDDMAPSELAREPEKRLTLDDALHMRWDYFECLVAVLWQRNGFRTVYRTADSHDDGVDVVAVGSHGELIQCKSPSAEHASIGWDAIKEVVAGEAAYRARHPGVSFKRVCVTNKFFNENALRHASLNGVELVDQETLRDLLERHVVTLLDVENVLYTQWDQVA